MNTHMPSLGFALRQERDSQLLSDLLEVSNAIFHREVAQFQVNQYRRLQELEKTLGHWRIEQIALGSSKEHVDFLCEEHLRKVRKAFREETRQYREIMLVEKEERDSNIRHYCLGY